MHKLAPKPSSTGPNYNYPFTSNHSTVNCSFSTIHSQPQPPPNESAQHAEMHAYEFTTFVQHLQDAALYIQNEAVATSVPNKDASVLIVRWEGDPYLADETREIESTLHRQYGFDVERCTIPLVHNRSAKLGAHMSAFFERHPNHLLIVYYAGYSYKDTDSMLYWASNTQMGAAVIKWDDIRFLFDDANSNILLLLDSCFPHNPQPTGKHGIKQVIAAYAPDQPFRTDTTPSLAPYLLNSLAFMSGCRIFTAEDLYRYIRHLMREKDPSLPVPVFATLTSNHSQDLVLMPKSGKRKAPAMLEDDLVDAEAAGKLAIGDLRVLVCSTFDAPSTDLAHFHHWLQHAPSAGRLRIESIFLGPPTVLMISMPSHFFEAIQHNKLCHFVAYINSANLVNTYDKVVAKRTLPHLKTRQDSEEMQEAAKQLQALSHVRQTPPPHGMPAHPGAAAGHAAPTSAAAATLTLASTRNTAAGILSLAVPLDAHGSNLSSANQASNHNTNIYARSDVTVAPLRQATGAIPVPGPGYASAAATAAKKSPRKALSSNGESPCPHCNVVTFRDASTLRKHIAAVHTRPFLCAFSFAGCTSTFGTKNEWKRHISSQHLCLQYYRCSDCVPRDAEGKFNEFNRKDLFTQHLRRMHAPAKVKTSLACKSHWESHVRDMQESCLVQRRLPPQTSMCPKPECSSIFTGSRAWDEWIEHVGDHLEKNQSEGMGTDQLLIQWSLREGIVEKVDDEYRLVASDKIGGH